MDPRGIWLRTHFYLEGTVLHADGYLVAAARPAIFRTQLDLRPLAEKLAAYHRRLHRQKVSGEVVDEWNKIAKVTTSIGKERLRRLLVRRINRTLRQRAREIEQSRRLARLRHRVSGLVDDATSGFSGGAGGFFESDLANSWGNSMLAALPAPAVAAYETVSYGLELYEKGQSAIDGLGKLQAQASGKISLTTGKSTLPITKTIVPSAPSPTSTAYTHLKERTLQRLASPSKAAVPGFAIRVKTPGMSTAQQAKLRTAWNLPPVQADMKLFGMRASTPALIKASSIARSKTIQAEQDKLLAIERSRAASAAASSIAASGSHSGLPAAMVAAKSKEAAQAAAQRAQMKVRQAAGSSQMSACREAAAAARQTAARKTQAAAAQASREAAAANAASAAAGAAAAQAAVQKARAAAEAAAQAELAEAESAQIEADISRGQMMVTAQTALDRIKGDPKALGELTGILLKGMKKKKFFKKLVNSARYEQNKERKAAARKLTRIYNLVRADREYIRQLEQRVSSGVQQGVTGLLINNYGQITTGSFAVNALGQGGSPDVMIGPGGNIAINFFNRIGGCVGCECGGC